MSTQANRLESLIDRVRRLPDRSLDSVEKFIDCLDVSNAQIAVQTQPPHLDSLDWPHAPLHRISERGTYIVTAGTLNKEHYFRSADRLGFLEAELLRLAKHYGWHLEAWAVFSNHYHFVGHSGQQSGDLSTFLSHLHTATANQVNQLDSAPERQVWFNYWETLLTYQKSYLARLNYVHQNAVKHGLVRVANQYRWCSAAWFERTASPAQVKTIYRLKTDRLRVFDDFDVVMPE